MTETAEKKTDFIRQMIESDLRSGKHKKIITRFPPEPNGYLHIGHAKSICLNFGIAEEFQGQCHLRFDDTNPLKEEERFVESMIEDVQWLGFKWDILSYSSDYYQALYDFACYLIKQGKAYVDSLSLEEIKAYRGTLLNPGQDSPYRNRSIEENLQLFSAMKAGQFENGTHVLRARINMQAANLNLRDPVLYRIRHSHHQRTGDAWCIYPMYDYAHPVSDALEYITHSLCTLEFQDHRPLYDWFIEQLPVPSRPVQTEFSRLNLSHTVTSKRKLRQLVEDKVVDGWDDPRLPTLQGMRKRGYPPEALRQFCEQIGVSRSDTVIDMTLLEACVRDHLNQSAKRALCVLAPLKVIISNYPEEKIENLEVSYTPNQEESELTQKRILPFCREIYIEQSDFMENPSKKYFRLSPGQEVRLRHAYLIRCEEIIRDEKGEIIALRCTYDKDSLGKNPTDRKVKGVIHWVSCEKAHPIEVLQYDRLFSLANPGGTENFLEHLNPQSLRIQKAYAEPALSLQPLGETFQFERLGYYAVNALDSRGMVKAFHRIVDLKDSWGKIA